MPTPPELECDQCIVEMIAFSDSWNKDRTFPLNAIEPLDPQCPKCRLRLCMACFRKDHIWCQGPGLDMTADLAVISRARAKGSADHALSFFKEEFHHIVVEAREKQDRGL